MSPSWHWWWWFARSVCGGWRAALIYNHSLCAVLWSITWAVRFNVYHIMTEWFKCTSDHPALVIITFCAGQVSISINHAWMNWMVVNIVFQFPTCSARLMHYKGVIKQCGFLQILIFWFYSFSQNNQLPGVSNYSILTTLDFLSKAGGCICICIYCGLVPLWMWNTHAHTNKTTDEGYALLDTCSSPS